MFWGGLILGAVLGGFATYLYSKHLFAVAGPNLGNITYDCINTVTCDVVGSSGDYRLYAYVYPADDTPPSTDFPHDAAAHVDENGDGPREIPGVGSLSGSVNAFVWLVDVVATGEASTECNSSSSSSSSSLTTDQ